MLGAIIGDIVGSRFEFNNINTKKFELFTSDCFFTDDTIMNIAIADSYMNKKNIKDTFKYYGKKYPKRGYGSNFLWWLYYDDEPYYSCGNGAPMRINPIAWLTLNQPQDSIDNYVNIYTSITHNHPEGLKAAHLQVKLIQMALSGKSKKQIKKEAEKFYSLPKKLKPVRFSELSQETMPIAITAFLKSYSFEDAIRNAISVGGDSDTIACITGALAEAYYGIPIKIINQVKPFLDNNIINIINQFYLTYDSRTIFR